MHIRMTNKEKKIFVFVIFISLIIVFFPYLFMGRKYLNTFDTLNLHIPFYTEFRNKIYSGDSLFWSHNFLFGSSFLTGKAFYLTTDIFSYIFLLFPFLEVVDALFVIQLIKCIVSYVLMYYFLNEFNISFKSKIIGSLAYTFSGWIFLFYGMLTFSSFAVLLPLLFIGIEQYLKNNRIVLIFISVILLIFSNFYLFYSLSLFLVFYWIARYLLYINDKFIFKEFIKKTLFLLLIYLLGMAVTSPIMIPAVDGMINNPRISGSGASEILWRPLRIYFDMFIKFISSPIYVSKPCNTVLQSNYYRLDQIGLFTTSCSCLLLPQILFIDSKRKRIICLIFSIITALFLFTQTGCSIFHGFSEPSFRWTLFITFVICFIFPYLLDRKEKINKNVLIISYLIYIVISLVFIIHYKMHFTAKVQFFAIALSLLLMGIYICLIIKNNQLIHYLILIEVVGLGLISNLLWKDKFQNSYCYDFIPSNYFQTIDDKNEFYRVWIADEHVDMDYNKDFNYNTNLVLNYKGFYSYDSEYESYLTDLIKSYGQYFQWYGFSYEGITTVASAKYYVAKSEEEIPNDNIKLIEKIGNSDYYLYFNNDYRQFGYTNNNVYSFEKWIYEGTEIKDQIIKDNLIINDEDIQHYKLNNLQQVESHYLSNLKYASDSFDGDITTETDELLFLSIPYNKGWKIYCDNKELNRIITDAGFVSVLVPKGNHHIHMRYVPYGFKAGCIISVVSILAFVLIINKNKFIKVNKK